MTLKQAALVFVTKAPRFWKFVSSVPLLRSWVNQLLINYAAGAATPRPYPLSLWSAKPGPSADYVSWTGLVDRTYTGRHLPPATAADIGNLPPVASLEGLFRRQGAMVPCGKSSALFCFFAQWFTDSFLRTNPDDIRLNTSNHEIDLCQIYGLAAADTALLRTKSQGLLKSQRIKGEEYPPYLFEAVDGKVQVKEEFATLSYIDPARRDYRRPMLDGLDTAERKKGLFAAGLERGNSTVFYSALNTLFLREHNRLCRRLAGDHPDWDDDRLFETARNVNIVQLLQIVVRDYINHLSTTEFKVFPEIGFPETRTWYRTNRITGEFDLLYRWHPLVPTTLRFEGRVLDSDEFRLNNALLTQAGLVKILDAGATQRAGKITLRNTPSFLVPADIAAMTKARGWRLKPYNDYRQQFGLAPVASFGELTGDAETAQLLQDTYGDVNKVDLLVGLFAEQRPDGSVLGDLMTVMVASDAFTQALTNPLLSRHVYGEAAFSAAGLASIEATSALQDIVRRNARLGEHSASFTYGADVTRTPPGFTSSAGLDFLKTFYDTVDFLFISGWERFFSRRQVSHRSTVFRVNLFRPTIAILDQRGISALFASRDLVQDYGFSWAVPAPALVGLVKPSVFETGAAHDGPKALYMRLLAWRAPSMPQTMAATMDRFCKRWATARSFTWRDGIEELAVAIVFGWMLGTEPAQADVRLVYLNIFTQMFIPLQRLVPWSSYSRSRLAYTRILEVIRNAPDFPRIVELARLAGVTDEDVIVKQLAFTLGMNSFLGIQNLLKSLVGELSLRPVITEALHAEAKSVDAEHPRSTPQIDNFIRETLRLHAPVTFVFGRATRNRRIESDSGLFDIRAGELVMGVIPFAQTDPAVIPRAPEFLPSRFDHPEAAKHLIWPRGVQNDEVTSKDRTCPGKDAAFEIARLFCIELLRNYEWKLRDSPVWDHRRFGLNVAAPKGPMEVTWFMRRTDTHPPLSPRQQASHACPASHIKVTESHQAPVAVGE